jgi:ATPase subunit of ABC transporter with duplicated ATPase domains
LSGGQRAKIIFLNMVLQKANVLILDEPTRNFSPLSAPVIRQALMDFRGTIISISHDRKYLDEVADLVYELSEDGLKLLQ